MKFRQLHKKHLFIVPLLGTFLFLILSPKTPQSDENVSLTTELYTKLKEQIKREVRDEIKDELYTEMSMEMQQMVKAEVRHQWETYLAEHVHDLWEQHARATETFHYSDEMKVYEGESVNDAVSRIIRDIFTSGEFRQYLSDNDLDNLVAQNNIPEDIRLKHDFSKYSSREAFETVKAQDQAATRGTYKLAPNDENWLITAGDENQTASIERTLVQKGSILLPKGQLQAEPSFTWSHFSSSNININGFAILDILVVGTIQTQKIKRDIFISNLSMKYGLLHNLQAELKVPFRGQYSRDTISQTSETTTGEIGIGDIEFGLSRQIGWEEGWLPDLIAAVNFKSRTGKSPYNRAIGLGTGHYAMRGSLIATKASDPAVIFGSLSYTQNFKRDGIPNIGDINPGNSIGYSLGMAIALSYQTAINFSFEHSLTDKLKINGRTIDGSLLNSASVKIGANWAFNERSSMDFGVSFGVTDDAPDLTVDVRFPFLF